MINENFIIVGVVLQILGSYSYLMDTLKGRVKPNRVTWLLWAIAPIIASIAMLKQGVGILAFSTLVVGLVPLVIFLASFVNKDAYWEIQKLDKICGLLSIIGLILWLVTRVGNIAIFFSLLADGLAAIPTLVKAYKNPETENATLFFYGVINAFVALLVIKTWNFESMAFPIYLLIMNAVFVYLIRLRKTNNVGTQSTPLN